MAWYVSFEIQRDEEDYLNASIQSTRLTYFLFFYAREPQIAWRPSEEQIREDVSRDARCKIFLGYTSNLVSSGIRETIKYLVKNKMVSLYLELLQRHLSI